MGYYTYYSLSASLYAVDPSNAPYPCQHKLEPVPEETINKINEYIAEHEDIQYSVGTFDSCGEANAGDTAKWYEHDEDMLEMSRHFPEVLFQLYGQGEESEDMWYSYYLDGKNQHCKAKIIFDDFDPAKLVEP